MAVKALAGLALVLVGLWAFSRIAVVVIEAKWPPVGRMVNAGGVAVHVIDIPGRENAPVLVLLHGASGNAREPLEALRDGLGGGRYRLISIDRPGHGYSSRGSADMSKPQRQADVVAATLRRLGVTSALVLGHSWGASVAAALAVGHPDVVAGLVFVAPATHPWPGGVSARSRFFATPVIGRVLAELVAVPAGLFIVPAAIRAVFDPDAVPDDYARRTGVLLVIRPKSFVANSQDVAGLYDNVVRLAARYGEIGVPTEILTGDRDPIVRPAIHAYGLARDIPGAHLTVLPGAGHMPHWSRTREVVEAIDRLAAQVSSRSNRAGFGCAVVPSKCSRAE